MIWIWGVYSFGDKFRVIAEIFKFGFGLLVLSAGPMRVANNPGMVRVGGGVNLASITRFFDQLRGKDWVGAGV